MKKSLLILALIGMSSWASAGQLIQDPMGYADRESASYSLGDSNSTEGWEPCHIENLKETPNLRIVCEGTRDILVHGGELFKVQYECEFVFREKNKSGYELVIEICQ